MHAMVSRKHRRSKRDKRASWSTFLDVLIADRRPSKCKQVRYPSYLQCTAYLYIDLCLICVGSIMSVNIDVPGGAKRNRQKEKNSFIETNINPLFHIQWKGLDAVSL